MSMDIRSQDRNEAMFKYILALLRYGLTRNVCSDPLCFEGKAAKGLAE